MHAFINVEEACSVIQPYVVQNILVGAVPSVSSDKLRKPVIGSARSSLKDLKANCQLLLILHTTQFFCVKY